MRWTLLLLLTAALFVPERTTAATLATGDIIVTDITLNAVYKVDPNDGTRTILSSGGSLDSPRAVVVSPTGFVFVTESGNTGTHNCGTGANPPCFRGVIRIDPSIAVGEPGNQVIASNSAVFASPRGIVIDSEIGDLLVADANSDTIYRINPASGSASVFSATTGGLESFHFPSDIALEANGDILVTDAPNPKSEPDRRLLRVARTGGTPVVLTKNDLVHGLFATPNGVAVEANGNIVIADSGAAGTATTPPVPASLIRVDRTTLTQSNIPVTGGLQGPRGIAVEQPSGNLLVADVSAKAVYRIDPSSGARTTLTSGSGLGPWGITVVGPLIDPTLLKSNLLVVDKGRQTIVRVTPAGAKLDLASPGALTAPVAVTRTRAGAPWNGALLVADGGAVRAIPPIPGSPMTVSDASFGPYLSNITGIVVDAGNDVLVTDSATDAVIRIKPNGAQSIVGMAGGDLTDPVGLVIDRDGLLVVVSNVTDALTGIHARIVRMNPVTGAHRVIVQDASLHEIRGIALDASGDVLLSDDAPVPQQPTGGVADSVRRLDARFEDLSVVTSAPAGVITSFQGVVADLNRDVIVANIPNPATTPSLPLELLRIDPLRPAIQTSFATAGTAFVELRGIALDAAPPVFELLDSDGDLRGDSVDNCIRS